MGDISVSGIVLDNVYKSSTTGEYYTVVNIADHVETGVQYVVCKSVQHLTKLIVCELDKFKFKLATKELYSIGQ